VPSGIVANVPTLHNVTDYAQKHSLNPGPLHGKNFTVNASAMSMRMI